MLAHSQEERYAISNKSISYGEDEVSVEMTFISPINMSPQQLFAVWRWRFPNELKEKILMMTGTFENRQILSYAIRKWCIPTFEKLAMAHLGEITYDPVLETRRVKRERALRRLNKRH
jgi:hypothetical protein